MLRLTPKQRQHLAAFVGNHALAVRACVGIWRHDHSHIGLDPDACPRCVWLTGRLRATRYLVFGDSFGSRRN